MIDASHIAAVTERFTTGYHFYLEDLRSGQSVELGQSGEWPIGSCFKLAVLVAYFEALADGSLPPGSLDYETLIPPERFSAGLGVLNLLDSPIRLTDRHMLHWMLAASDGTTTDVLIERVGLARVQAALKRLAPDSALSCNLNDMVKGFQAIDGAMDCKTRDWPPEAALAFRRQAARLGHTHARDLAGLALRTFEWVPSTAAIEAAYQALLTAPRMPLQRAATFLDAPLGHFAKTGSIGRNYFTAEGGVILWRDQPVARFGYCSEGWRLPAFAVETVCGLIGLEMARALGFDPEPNRDWTPEGAELLLGDLWRD